MPVPLLTMETLPEQEITVVPEITWLAPAAVAVTFCAPLTVRASATVMPSPLLASVTSPEQVMSTAPVNAGLPDLTVAVTSFAPMTFRPAEMVEFSALSTTSVVPLPAISSGIMVYPASVRVPETVRVLVAGS